MKTTCLYCGNNPVNHTEQYLSETLTLLLSASLPRVSVRNQERFIGALFVLATPLAFVLRLVGLYRWQTPDTEQMNGRSKVLYAEAQQRGIEMQQLCIAGSVLEHYRARIAGVWRYFSALPIPLQLVADSEDWLDDKFRLKRFLQSHGIPVPQGGAAWNQSDALKIFETLQKPVIVKPRKGSRGRHTLTYLSTSKECANAFKIASELCQCVMVEEHLRGSVYRGTYVHGEIVGVLRGDAPQVVGDGHSTLRELVDTKNGTRPARVGTFTFDEKAIAFLGRKGQSPETVPANGVAIDLSEKIGLSYGGNAIEMLPSTHPKIIEILTRAGDALGAAVVGFDFIIEDATKDPDTQRWGIIEGNARPFIDLHHSPLEGPSINVAARIWDLWK